MGDEEDSNLGNFIEDKNAILTIGAAIQASLRESTTRVLASLTPRIRFRQIEAKALRKLKHPSRSRKLRSFLDN